MTPEAMAALHARAFEGKARAWGAAEFEGLLESGHVFVVGGNRAFALGRALAGEAELLTLATDPDLRSLGLGRAALIAFEEAARGRGANRAFLEVAADNAPARALYRSRGFEEIARRAAYYRQGVDALILEKLLV